MLMGHLVNGRPLWMCRVRRLCDNLEAHRDDGVDGRDLRLDGLPANPATPIQGPIRETWVPRPHLHGAPLCGRSDSVCGFSINIPSG
jgi:hypothetical protein